MFRRNMGGLDRGVRLVLGMVLLPAGLFLLSEPGGNLFGLVIAAAGLVGLVTGAAGFCPLYVPLGISTAEWKGSKTFRHID